LGSKSQPARIRGLASKQGIANSSEAGECGLMRVFNPKTGIGFIGENRESRERTTDSTKRPEDRIPNFQFGNPSASVVSVSSCEWSLAFEFKALAALN